MNSAVATEPAHARSTTNHEPEPDPQPREFGSERRDGLDCVIVGGGPAGMMLGLLLALADVRVKVLEAHPDFDRDFRGDTIHPSTLEILDQIGLAEPLLEIPHGKITDLSFHAAGEVRKLVDLTQLKSKYNFIAMMPQVRLLSFLAERAGRLPGFELEMSAEVRELVVDDGVIRGVRHRAKDGKIRENGAKLVVAADGRSSKIRRLLELEPKKTSPPMDVLWFRLAKREGDPAESGAGYIGSGKLIILLDREDQWQLGFVLPKGGYHALRDDGIDLFKTEIKQMVPWLAGRLHELSDWRQCAVLAVESSRIPVWHKPGVLLIGDAAHVMSPVGGVGINYAVQDAVVAANVLAKPLAGESPIDESLLAKVQRARERPVAIIQTVQSFIQKSVVSTALASASKPFRFPLALRLINAIPLLRTLPARLIAYGPKRVRIEDPRPFPE